MGSPSFFFSAPEIEPLTVCDLCRGRHKSHYADARIMPMQVGKSLFLADAAAIGSA